ncbi:polyprenyl synthetase family protein [Acuticoccus sp. M5D2P5]|uniref:polyprenyl synthetase family protein n=1 Tax=Acuticoccus kalidii TaxID=2910977 RepID=UPI001F4421DF|nr:polyprenyl synthetase family protein [Acuticoccus kalidii]MCF3932662.1 polyprenyl synthetase family protein [Acuticoccus kalidii]
MTARIEAALERHLAGRDRPARLGEALRHAVFGGGSRVRPALVLGVAHACGDDRPIVTDGYAAAVEFLHCASLVHDDLPAFDDAPLRRGRPSVHAHSGEALAILAGDGLIVLAFRALADVASEAGARLPQLLSLLAESAGSPDGLVAGQAMESEARYDLAHYHAAKTGALFRAATAGGAAASGGDVAFWREIGVRLGAAYQIADDLHDRFGRSGSCGKLTGRDDALGRPNAVDTYGVDGALRRIKHLIEETVDVIPAHHSAEPLRSLIHRQAMRLVPEHL